MSRRLEIVGFSACLFAVMPLASGHATQLPAGSTYNEYQYVVSSSSKPSGLTSCNPVGATLGGYFYYPGPGKRGGVSYGPSEDGKIMHQLVCTYPATPAGGVASWSGTASCTDTYTSGAPNTYLLTFDWKLTFVTAKTFLAVRTITYPVPGGTCTEVRNTGFSRSGN